MEVQMKGIILYYSKYGATKKYASWLVEETGFICVETEKAKIQDVVQYDVIILAGGIYATGIGGIKFLRKYQDLLKGKNVIVFCCGASPCEEKAFQQVKDFNMKNISLNVPFFYGRGAWDVDSMSFVHRKLISLLKKMLAKKDPKDYEIWEKALVEAGDAKADWTDKKYIKPLLEYLNQ